MSSVTDSHLTACSGSGRSPWWEGRERAVKAGVPRRAHYLKGQIDPRFGRALFFLVVDMETNQFRILDNTWIAQVPEDAGTRAADNVVAMGVDAVLTRHISPRALATLQAKNVAVYATAEASVWEAVQRFRSGGPRHGHVHALLPEVNRLDEMFLCARAEPQQGDQER